MTVVVTIDGPGGAGKGTLSQMLAKELGWHFLDSGAMYRLCGLACLQQGIDFADEQKIAEAAQNLDIDFRVNDNALEVWLDGQEVSQQLRVETTASAASKVAVIPAVRDALLARQRAFAQAPGLIADGRDMGTVVFPNAELKIYLTASAEERAQRRYKQLQESGSSVSLAAILQEIQQRDERDMNRAIAPLKPAEDAVIIDSSNIDAQTVYDQVLQLIKQSNLA